VKDLTDTKTEKVAGIIAQVYHHRIDRLLVVGCGDGVEAAILSSRLDASVTGIDVADSFDPTASQIADLRIGDAMNLEFADESFDFVFSYHALEHIADPNLALREMHRVLRRGGGFWIGTPNRTRLVGYIGAKEGSVSEKIRWNVADYRARITGRFRNELGAHAGFSAPELRGMLAAVFDSVTDVTRLYFKTVYGHRRLAAKAIDSMPFPRLIYPSVYFHGVK
jgi:ubiquinone/menaquinone biosynthesis C-methylase UbiE